MNEITIADAIERIEKHTQHYVPVDDLPYLEMALDALRGQAEAEKNEPLTLEELRKMDGEPVWVVFTPDADGETLSMWALVSVDVENDEIFLLNSIGGISAYEEIYADIKAIYRRKPEEVPDDG